MLLGSDTPLHREAWHRLKGWYLAAVDRAPPHAQVILKWIMTERVELYSYVPPLGENIPISVEPLPVDESVPMEDDIKWEVSQPQNHCSGGPSGMRFEHLKGWLAASKKKEREEYAAEKEHPIEERTMEGPGGMGERRRRRGGDTHLRRHPTGRWW